MISALTIQTMLFAENPRLPRCLVDCLALWIEQNAVVPEVKDRRTLQEWRNIYARALDAVWLNSIVEHDLAALIDSDDLVPVHEFVRRRGFRVPADAATEIALCMLGRWEVVNE